MKIKIRCLVCDNEFLDYLSNRNRKFCSKECYYKSLLKNPKDQLGVSASERVKRYAIRHRKLFYDNCPICGIEKSIKSKSCRKCITIVRPSKLRKDWKGKNVGYRCLHLWVERILGKPETCEYCGKSGLKGKQIHWANKSHQYKRELTDWIRLCSSCHKYYDMGKRRKIIIHSELS
jgi:hypothetical protein